MPLLTEQQKQFSQDRSELLEKHLAAQIGVEFFTIPFYLNAVYSFSNAATSYTDTSGQQPLYNLQQKTLSVAIQEMYHLQLACNLANAFDVAPVIPTNNFVAGEELIVPHLEPDDKPLSTYLGNLPATIDAMEAVEKPAPPGPRPEPRESVEYPSIGDLYYATLALLKEYIDAFGALPESQDPHFNPGHNQVAYNTFASRYKFNAINSRDDVKETANAITDQGEGNTVAGDVGAPFKAGASDDVLPEYQPSAGSRFYEYDKVTHFRRFEDIDETLKGTDWEELIGAPVFYTPDGTPSPDLPSWAPSAQVCQDAIDTTWSYLVDVMQNGFADGNLQANQPAGVSFNDAMISFKYTIPLVWQHGQCPSFRYRAGVTIQDVQTALDNVDPLCLSHWDPATAKVRADHPNQKNACQGLNDCAGLGWGGIATDKGKGACATADFHTCQGGNDCSHQGACGFLSTDPADPEKKLPASEQWIPGENHGAQTGGCQTPISSHQVFNSKAEFDPSWTGPAKERLEALRGTSVWDEARKLFAQRESETAPPELDPAQEKDDIDYDGIKRRAAVAPTSTT